MTIMQALLSERCVCVHLEELQVASRDLLGEMSVKAQPYRCIRHLINLRICEAKGLDLWTECVSVCTFTVHVYDQSVCKYL